MEKQREEDLSFALGWSNELLTHMQNSSGADIPELMHRCSQYHYTALQMDQLLAPFISNLDAFLQFLSKEWGWIITYDKSAGVITANENKEQCVCPIVRGTQDNRVSPVLCHCSEGFGKRMFEKVIGREVKAEVISSILRGDKNCIYRITL